MLNMLEKISADSILKYFSQQIGFGISCKLSLERETVCMKCQSLFSGKNKKTIINLSSAESAQGAVSLNLFHSGYKSN